MKAESPGFQSISNSMEPSLSVAAVAFQPLLARVVTSASPVSRFSVTSLALSISVQSAAAGVTDSLSSALPK